MKITRIDVDRYGVWHGLHLPLPDAGLNVFYGPNEAGKTTLMRFLREMLYGFEPWNIATDGVRREPPQWGGRLSVRHDGRALEILRRAHPETRGVLTLRGGDASPEEELSGILGISKSLYEHVFAVGLLELQELATLDDENVAQLLYGLSLGPQGRTLLDVLSRIEAERARMLGTDGRDGELTALLARDAQLAAAIDDAGQVGDRYAELESRLDGVDAEIAALKRRQVDAHLQLRGHLFLERVWGPWNNVRECREELATLPDIAGFPEHGMERLDDLESQLRILNEARDSALAEAKRLRQQAQAVPLDPEVLRHASAMRSFLDQREWLHETAERIEAAEERAQSLKADFDEQLAVLGEGWTPARLGNVDASPSACARLRGQAQKYRAALRRRARFKRQSLRTSELCHQRTTAIEERLKELGGQSIDEAAAACRQKIADLQELERLKGREADLEQRLGGTTRQLEDLESRLALPGWVLALLAGFAVAGIAGAGMGLITGITTNVIAGLMWALLGATCGGLAWALKTHFQGAVSESLQELQQEERRTEERLRDVREAISAITRRSAPLLLSVFDPGRSPGAASPEAEPTPLQQARDELLELERMADELRKLRHRRRQLSEFRRRRPAIQRDVSAARQAWCELVVQLGLPETVRIKETLDTWQQAAEADERRRTWEAAREELRTLQRVFQGFRKRLETLGHRIGRVDDDYGRPLDVLPRWEQELKELARRRREQKRLRREERECRARAAEFGPQIDELRTQRAALLVQGGASTREEFEARAAHVRRRRESEELLELASAELDAAEQTQPDLAIVEEDLLSFDAQSNAAAIARINADLERLEAELQQACERAGGIKQQLEALRQDRGSASLRYDRSQLRRQTRRALERWAGLQTAAQAVYAIRQRVERTCQPATLATAARYLEQLTAGRYRTLWTPLGERRLRVEGEDGRALRVEELSNGTREQLFLAVRLALVREFAEQGIELPMVLDDILVNFDQSRTEAAIDTLIDFARSGQQILFFTCHLHLAHLFEARGVEPIWLPGHERLLEHRRAG